MDWNARPQRRAHTRQASILTLRTASIFPIAALCREPPEDAPVATRGHPVSVHYTGRLEDGTVFDSSHTYDVPIEFTLGAREVIRGWDEGIASMRVGGKRQLVIPPHLGYGARGACV